MINALANLIGLPCAVLLIFGCIAIPVLVVVDAIMDWKNSGRPKKAPSLHPLDQFPLKTRIQKGKQS